MDLLQILDRVPDGRGLRGRIYGLAFVLAASLVAVLAGATNYRQIGDQIADFSQSLLGQLGAPWCFFREQFGYPSRGSIGRILSEADPVELDRATGEWLRKNTCCCADGQLVLAIDGKVLRGAWNDDNETFTLFSAMVHNHGVTVAQVAVPSDTKETTQVKALLDRVRIDPGTKVVVTADAAHAYRATADYLAGQRGFDYVMTIKANQYTLQKAIFDTIKPHLRTQADHIVQERGHGRVSKWQTWITDAAGINFPSARQIACIRRDGFMTTGTRISKEIAIIVTSSKTMTATDLHRHVRNHWGIENLSHYVRDTVWREDSHQAYTGNGPHIMATLRNTASGILRLNGHTNIKQTTEWIARDRNRALPLIATLRHIAYLQRS